VTEPGASALTFSEFTATAAAAQPVAPGTPPRQLELPPGEQSFAFSVDRDLTKLVTLSYAGSRVSVRVRFADDAVVEDRSARIDGAAEPRLTVDDHGIALSWRAPLIPGLNWPQTRRSRRF
jgi:hypothetical protein